MIEMILFVIICLLCIIPLFFASCKTTIKRAWIDRVIYIGGWIFVPFLPVSSIITVFFRLEHLSQPLVWRHKTLLAGKTWEEIRRRNFYLMTEISSFFVSLISFFSFISYFRNSISEKYFPYIIVLGIILVIMPPVIFYKIFTVYEKKLKSFQK